jgi:ATP-binding cassette subfamily G (WHITE) protein 1
MEAATAVAPLLTMPTILFGGLFINTTSMPSYLSWIRWTSPVYYANCGMLLAQWRTAPNPFLVKPNPYTLALDFLIGDISYSECVYALIALLFVWRVASYIALKRSVTKF